MKIALALLDFVLASCSPFYLNTAGYEIKHENLDIAWARIANYQYQAGPPETCKSPNEFFRDGGGDCGDFAIALVYLLGPEASVLGIQSSQGEHAIVEYKSKYIEPQVYGMYYILKEIVIVHRATYYEIMELATNNGTKGVLK
jgi:hypothetical protein